MKNRHKKTTRVIAELDKRGGPFIEASATWWRIIFSDYEYKNIFSQNQEIFMNFSLYPRNLR
jgi:hypothetical protein